MFLLLIKLSLALSLLFMSLGLSFIFLLVGLWCHTGFVLLALLWTIFWRVKSGGGRDRYYFIAYALSLIAATALLLIFTEGNLMGMHRIMDGYAAPLSTEVFLAVAPLVLYAACLRAWTKKPEA